MKILVAIANYGVKNDAYLSRVLCEYRRLPYQTDIVVLSNVPKDLGSDVQVVVGLPSKNPHSLPFAHKRILAERKDEYDLFIYSEDDILITQRNIQAFLRVTDILPPQEVAGFFRWEQHPNGTKSYPDVHACYRWVPESVKVIDDHAFARFTNDHSGCYMLTRKQLAQAIASGGFLVPPHQHKYQLLETAATDPYTQCGFRRVICLSHLDEFLVPHLPNKYIGSRLGLGASEFCRQLEVLFHPRQSRHANGSLLEPETKVFHREWSKDYYEPCREDLITQFPASTHSVLSIGCGWGETEAELVRKGVELTAIPLDSVIAACAESRGVKVVYGGIENAMAQLRARRFDGVLMSGVLHLLENPSKALRQASALLSERGVLVATVPNFRRLPFLWLWLQHPSRYTGLRDFQRSGVHPVNRREAKAWFCNTGLSLERISETIPERWKALVASSGGLAKGLFSSECTFIARRTASPESASAHSVLTEEVEAEHQVTLISNRGSDR
jgi:2-polyprenyl-3-methyl-5-hydroxy-6-metoxy-1,4-benzoquinol methylase